MQAIEFEAIAQHRTLRLPEQVPDGVRLRVLVLMEEDIQCMRPALSTAARPIHKPSPGLAGSVVMHDDLLVPAVPEEDWSTLK